VSDTIRILKTYGLYTIDYIDPGYCARINIRDKEDYYVCEDTMEKVLERLLMVIKANMWVMC